MAWRIADYIERGEIDNRTRDRVTGQLWISGVEDPIRLELAGNPYRDLAGQYLRFTNPKPKTIPRDLAGIAAEQMGVVGDMTAARKVKVLDIADEDLEYYYTNKIPMPHHWSNCLYLEWHSERNGRVVIEATDYRLEVEPEATWQMSEAEEAEQLEANARAMTNFMDTLLEETVPFEIDSIEDDDDDEPQSRAEAEADSEAARMDLLNDRVIARLKKNEDANADDYWRILEEERERLRRERGSSRSKFNTLTPEERELEELVRIEILNADFEEAMAKEGEPPELAPDPLFERCQELGIRVREEIDENDWLPESAQEEHPLHVLGYSIWYAAAKLAGALNGKLPAWPPDSPFAGDCLVRLKKARGYLGDALASLEAVQAEKLTEASWIPPKKQELQSILNSVQNLIEEVRAVLKHGE